ncbi:NADP-dependent phosphogluconate dehydrogenase, partial [Patescibacteria group bacterium]|nr:NADP-dependent phosphogluconate dehydrogenase [Patescibacteria group bacterium]
MKKHIGYIGLGKMGLNMAIGLNQRGWKIAVFDVSPKAVETASKEGLQGMRTIQDLVQVLPQPRLVWIMVPAGKPVDAVLDELSLYLEKDDIVIDGGNSFFENSVKRAKKLSLKGIHFLDVGVSGGPGTVRQGKPAIMIGGDKAIFQNMKPLFLDLTRVESFGYMGRVGTGHFVKMVHNGIEYGIMQSLAEGFGVMKESPFSVNLEEVARVYNNGSVIESRLTGWMLSGFQTYGQNLKAASGSVAHTGEGEWTVK